MVLVLETNKTRTTIIQVYAPTEASSEEQIEEFYEILGDNLAKYKSPTNLIIGDFNSKIGCRTPDEEANLGPHGYGIRNGRGERLIQFAQENNLKIANTFF